MAQNTRNVAMQFSLKNNIKRSNIIVIITCSFMIVFIAFNHLYLSMGRYWNVRSVWETIFPTNSSHRYSTQPNYRSTPNYPTKTKARVPLSLFVAMRLFSHAHSRSGVHITRFSQKNKMCGISTIWRKMCGISFFLSKNESLNETLKSMMRAYSSPFPIRKPRIVCASLFSLAPPSSRFEKHFVSSLALFGGVFFIHQRQTD